MTDQETRRQEGTVSRPARATNLVPQAADQTSGAEPFRSTRREPRSPAELTFAVCGLTSSGRFFVELCSTVNVSRTGCCLRLRTRPQTDSALALRAVPGGTSLSGTGCGLVRGIEALKLPRRLVALSGALAALRSERRCER